MTVHFIRTRSLFDAEMPLYKDLKYTLRERRKCKEEKKACTKACILPIGQLI